MDDIYELYNLLKLPIDKQDLIIKDLMASELKISQENVTKLNNEIEIGRVNSFLEEAVKKAKPKAVKKPRAKKVVKEVDEESASEQIFDLEI